MLAVEGVVAVAVGVSHEELCAAGPSCVVVDGVVPVERRDDVPDHDGAADDVEGVAERLVHLDVVDDGPRAAPVQGERVEEARLAAGRDHLAAGEAPGVVAHAGRGAGDVDALAVREPYRLEELRRAAVTAAGLAETLSGPGPFTVFAPVNDAFAALPDGTVETLLQPENKDQLTNVLLYHVDDRNLSAAQIPAGSNFFKPILTSERTCITKDANGVTVADGTGDTANVIIADIKADNGVIHVIDKVLLPGTRPDCH